MPIHHIHSSSRGPKPASTLETALDEFITKADLITLTEVRFGARVTTLKERGWSYFHGGGEYDQAPVMWSNLHWGQVHAASYEAADQVYSTEGGGTTHAPYITAVVLEQVGSKKRFLVMVVHPPASIEGGSGEGGIWDPTVARRVIAAQQTIRSVKRIKRRLVKRFKPQGVMVVGDWNLNINRAAVRAFFTARFPRMTVNWRMDTTEHGTLGKRFIDFALLRGVRVVHGPTSHTTPSSDHRYVQQTLEFV